MLIQRLVGPDSAREAEIKVLIEKLDMLMVEMKDAVTTQSDYLTDEENSTSKIKELSTQASGIFISNAGQSVYTTFLALYSANKYRIVPGEQDSSGWITGVIITPKGRIVYG